jgi:hypothetical protein
MRGAQPLLLALFTLPSLLQAQRIGLNPFAVAPPMGPPPLHSTSLPRDTIRRLVDQPSLVIGGLIGAAAGAIAGAAFGHRYDDARCRGCNGSLLFGALIGESLGAPIGVHVAGGGTGDFATSLSASLAIGTVGWWALETRARVPILIAVPIAQIGAAISQAGRRAGERASR